MKDSLASIKFEGQSFQSPIAYAFMYVQWEANEVKILINILINIPQNDATYNTWLTQLRIHLLNCKYFLDYRKATYKKSVFDVRHGDHSDVIICTKHPGN